MTILYLYVSCMFLYAWNLWHSGLFGYSFSWKILKNDWDLLLEIIFWPIEVIYVTFNVLSKKDSKYTFVKSVYFYLLDLFNL